MGNCIDAHAGTGCPGIQDKTPFYIIDFCYQFQVIGFGIFQFDLVIAFFLQQFFKDIACFSCKYNAFLWGL